MKNIRSLERGAKIILLCAHTKHFSGLFLRFIIILILINGFIFNGVFRSLIWWKSHYYIYS